MFLSRSWRWPTTLLGCEMSSSPDTFQVLLTWFASMVSNTVSKSTRLGQPHLVWSLRVMPPEWNFFNHLLTVWWSTVSSLFAQQIILVASAASKVNSNWRKFPNESTFHNRLWDFQILHGMKQRTTCQSTNYRNNGHLEELELFQSRDIRAANLHVWNYCTTFVLSTYFSSTWLNYVNHSVIREYFVIILEFWERGSPPSKVVAYYCETAMISNVDFQDWQAFITWLIYTIFISPKHLALRFTKLK